MNGKPIYNLKKVKELLKNSQFKITRNAQMSALKDFGFDDEIEIIKTVSRLHISDFYKCMPSEKTEDWQDVYFKEIDGVIAYIKLQIRNEELLIIISFKKK